MTLLWLRYEKDSKTKSYILLIQLGEKENHILGLESRCLSPVDKVRIKHRSGFLDALALDKRLEWVRDNCPSFSRAYRTLKKANTTIEDQWSL